MARIVSVSEFLVHSESKTFAPIGWGGGKFFPLRVDPF